MVRKYTKKRSMYKKKTYRKRKSAKKLAINRSQFGSFPANKIVKMRSVISLTQSLVAGQMNFLFFANSIADPWTYPGAPSVLSAHRPLGYDQWAQFYSEYCVLGSKLKVTVTGSTSSANGSAVMSIQQLPLPVVPGAATTIATIIEQKRGTYKLMPGFAGIGTKTVTSKFSTKKFFAVKDPQDDPTLSSDWAGSPTNGGYYFVRIQDTDAASTDTYSILMVMDLIVLLKEPKAIAGSNDA